ncbi:uncharacterized protein BDZ99DRAFT_223702 [Mytilinidion resinicola]|uniref:Uncharacterized protein n=1 Tax=Mytilinidion resinicola TaxID=574789 RepID=A0A6A6Z0H3_9PEZI|nr:uncharacterized protein BDZ99DRAFT_223702 [Mytilinidion resinicola]KAF2813727.1 hypothetical protein BDZ99DRAFT_223702 [Mytilinidion resinicola]
MSRFFRGSRHEFPLCQASSSPQSVDTHLQQTSVNPASQGSVSLRTRVILLLFHPPLFHFPTTPTHIAPITNLSSRVPQTSRLCHNRLSLSRCKLLPSCKLLPTYRVTCGPIPPLLAPLTAPAVQHLKRPLLQPQFNRRTVAKVYEPCRTRPLRCTAPSTTAFKTWESIVE